MIKEMKRCRAEYRRNKGAIIIAEDHYFFFYNLYCFLTKNSTITALSASTDYVLSVFKTIHMSILYDMLEDSVEDKSLLHANIEEDYNILLSSLYEVCPYYYRAPTACSMPIEDCFRDYAKLDGMLARNLEEYSVLVELFSTLIENPIAASSMPASRVGSSAFYLFCYDIVDEILLSSSDSEIDDLEVNDITAYEYNNFLISLDGLESNNETSTSD